MKLGRQRVSVEEGRVEGGRAKWCLMQRPVHPSYGRVK